ncbi:hypothetical protein AAY473_038481 [Plecturocebus cupreus]
MDDFEGNSKRTRIRSTPMFSNHYPDQSAAINIKAGLSTRKKSSLTKSSDGVSCNGVISPRLTATSASWVQVILLPQPPDSPTEQNCRPQAPLHTHWSRIRSNKVPRRLPRARRSAHDRLRPQGETGGSGPSSPSRRVSSPRQPRPRPTSHLLLQRERLQRTPRPVSKHDLHHFQLQQAAVDGTLAVGPLQLGRRHPPLVQAVGQRGQDAHRGPHAHAEDTAHHGGSSPLAALGVEAAGGERETSAGAGAQWEPAGAHIRPLDKRGLR